jgi:predicted ATPase
MNSFVGRDRDLQALRELFAGGARCVTVLGPAGVGKTRLALAFASESVVCDLTGASTAFDVASTIGRALDAPLFASSTVEEATASLLAHLAQRDLLLVLDNIEQVAARAAPIVSKLVQAGARVLATSRERLRIAEESVLDLAPLALDDAQVLFLDRARAVRHGYAPTTEEAEAIRGICADLDGLPLAIELAAARMRVLTAVDLRERLKERFAVLASSDRTHSPRHATLRTAIDWSWASLTDVERSALAQCAVFEGGFTLEAAEEILKIEGSVLDALHALRDKSLVWAKETELGLRFGLYLGIHDYAAEKLDRDDAAFDRHSDWYLARCFYWAAHSEGPEGADARAHLEAEQPNLLAVHRRAVAARSAERAVRAALALQPVLIARGPAALRLELLDRALELAESDPSLHPRLVGWAMLARGDTLYGVGRMADSRAMFERSIEVGAAHHDERLEGRALWMLGLFHTAQDRNIEAAAALERGLLIHRKVKDRIHEGRCLSSLGALALEDGRLDEASERFEEAMALLEETKDERWIGRTIELLGGVEDARGNVEEARQLYLQAISVHERSGDRRHLAHALGAMAALDAELGNSERAEQTFERALAIRHEVPDRRTEGWVRVLFGICLEQKNDVAGALKSYREAVRIYKEIESPRALTVALAHRARAEGKRPRLEEARACGVHDPQIDALLGIIGGHLSLADDPRNAEEALATALPIAHRSTLVRRAARALRAALSDGLPDDALVVGSGWFKAPRARRIDISSRRAPSSLLSALAVARKQRPGASLTVEELFEAGWPGEKALPAAAASRVYVAISTLRKIGLKELIIRDDAGYRLDPSVPLLEG